MSGRAATSPAIAGWRHHAHLSCFHDGVPRETGHHPPAATVTAVTLARQLSDAAVAYRIRHDSDALLKLESLAETAAARVRRVGEGTVDHIVLSSILRRLVLEVPHLEQVLARAGWRWSM
jgi:RNA:NAD 2'-phosphotransferase (TPT1/KptA family)